MTPTRGFDGRPSSMSNVPGSVMLCTSSLRRAEMRSLYFPGDSEKTSSPSWCRVEKVALLWSLQGSPAFCEASLRLSFAKVNERTRAVEPSAGIAESAYFTDAHRGWSMPRGTKYPRGKTSEAVADIDVSSVYEPVAGRPAVSTECSIHAPPSHTLPIHRSPMSLQVSCSGAEIPFLWSTTPSLFQRASMRYRPCGSRDRSNPICLGEANPAWE